MSEPVTVRILDREYTVGVQEDERASLTAAARVLDQRMRELRGGNKMVALDRLAVLTALNLAHELQQRGVVDAGDDAVFAMIDRVHAAIDLVAPESR